MASAKTVCNLLLSAETFVCQKQLPAETASFDGKQIQMDSLSRTPYFHGQQSWKEATDRESLVMGEAKMKYDGQSRQEVKNGRLVYTL